jgi:hypothetical protein
LKRAAQSKQCALAQSKKAAQSQRCALAQCKKAAQSKRCALAQCKKAAQSKQCALAAVHERGRMTTRTELLPQLQLSERRAEQSMRTGVQCKKAGASVFGGCSTRLSSSHRRRTSHGDNPKCCKAEIPYRLRHHGPQTHQSLLRWPVRLRRRAKRRTPGWTMTSSDTSSPSRKCPW